MSLYVLLRKRTHLRIMLGARFKEAALDAAERLEGFGVHRVGRRGKFFHGPDVRQEAGEQVAGRAFPRGGLLKNLT